MLLLPCRGCLESKSPEGCAVYLLDHELAYLLFIVKLCLLAPTHLPTTTKPMKGFKEILMA